MSGTFRIIVGIVILSIGLYSFYDTLSENSQIPDSTSAINPVKITNSLFLNIIQSIMIATGTVIFGSGVRSRKR